MGSEVSHPKESERKYWQKKNRELWLNSKTYKQICRTLRFVSNFHSFDLSMSTLQAKTYPLIYSVLQIKRASSLSLQCVDISIDSYKELRHVVKVQDSLVALRLSFEAKQKDEVKHHLNTLGKVISTKTTLLYLTLGNWGKIDQLEINGTVLATILNSTKLRGLTIQKVGINNLEDFTDALSKSSTIRSLCMQSSSQYSKDEVKLIYASVAANPRIEKIEVYDKSLHPQIDWKEYAKFLEVTKKIHELKIHGETLITQSAIPELCSSLENNTSLKRITFTGFEKSSVSKNKSLLKSIEWHPTLEVLDLTNNKVDSEVVVVGLCRVIQVCPKLRELILAHIFHGREDSRGSALELLKKLENNKAITVVDLSANCFKKEEEDALVGLIAGQNVIQSLSLSRCSLSDETLSKIFKALASNTTIEALDIRAQHRKYSPYSEAGKCIAQCLSSNSMLKSLHMQGNEFTDEGLKEISAALTANKEVTQIYMTYTGNAKEIVKAIGETLKENSRIEKFSLEKTQQIESNPIFKRLAYNKGLVSLELQAVIFTQKSLATFGSALKENCILKVLKMVGEFEKGGAVALSEGLALNEGIQYISLTNSNISREDSVQFIPFLKENKKLEYLQLYYKVLDLEDKDVDIVIDTLTNNKTLKSLSMTYGSFTEKGVAELKKIQRKHFWLKIEIV